MTIAEGYTVTTTERTSCVVDVNRAILPLRPQLGLSAEAEQARNQVIMSFIPPVGRRAVAVFLGRDNYRKMEQNMEAVTGHLMMEALPRFAEERGGHVVASMRFQHDENETVLNVVESSRTINGRVYEFVTEGSVFIHMKDERIVVSVESEWTPEGQVFKIATRSNRDSVGFFSRWKAFTRDHNFLRGRAFFANGEVIERRRIYTWDDIFLADEVKRAVRLHVEGFLANRDALKALGMKARRGILLEGPPGSGKTLLGKVLADTLECSFMWVTPRHVQNSEFHQIMSLARSVAPVVIFFEDIDLFAEDRQTKGGLGLGELMNQLDGALENEGIVTIATTNHIDFVERALRNRPGRFDRVLHVGAMDESCRRKFLSRLLVKAITAHADAEHLIQSTEGCTGAQIEELVNTMYMLSVDMYNAGCCEAGNGRLTISRDHIDAALGAIGVKEHVKAGFGGSH